MSSINAQRMPVAELAIACRTETSRYRGGESCSDGYCFELIRRAVCNRDDAAWEAVMAQYRGLVLSWVRQHPASTAVVEDDDYWVTRTFERFWMAVGPERFSRFSELGAVAQYLKMCVHSVLLDEVRARRAAPTEPLGDEEDEMGHGPDVGELVVDRLNERDLWRTIQRVLPDEPSRLAIYLSFALDLKPNEIHRRCPQHYSGVADVYRVKRNALERLRRSSEIRDGYAAVATRV
jgi:DNA-directed RNA polymerase specialized sigma24 family protein